MSELSTLDLINQIIEELKEESYEVAWWQVEDEFEEREIPFEVVHTAFEDGGRWFNYYDRVVNVYDEYFQISEKVPASEMQEGSGEDGIESITQVYPKQVTKTIYVSNIEG